MFFFLSLFKISMAVPVFDRCLAYKLKFFLKFKDCQGVKEYVYDFYCTAHCINHFTQYLVYGWPRLRINSEAKLISTEIELGGLPILPVKIDKKGPRFRIRCIFSFK